MRALLAGGASANVRTRHNMTAAQIAAYFGREEIAELIAMHGAVDGGGSLADGPPHGGASGAGGEAARRRRGKVGRGPVRLPQLSVALADGAVIGGAALRRALDVWERLGAIVFPQLLPESLLGPLRKHAAATLREAGGTDHALHIRQSRGRSLRAVPVAHAAEAVGALVRRLAPFLAAALGAPLALLESGVMRTAPGAEDQSFHSDSRNFDGRLASVQISLVDTAATQGALEVVPGTHGMDGAFSGASSGASSGAAAVSPVKIAVPAGTVAFYSPSLRHRGSGNTHRNERLFLGLTLLAQGGVVPSGIPYAMERTDVGQWWADDGRLHRIGGNANANPTSPVHSLR